MARIKNQVENMTGSTALSEKIQRIQEVKKKLEKDFGKGTVIGAKDKPRKHDVVPTGSIGLDKAIGIGGLPKGRIVEIYGPESSGKTTIAMHLIAEAHKADPNSFCAFVDAEHAFDIGYAESLGIDLDRFEISQPDYGEQALEVVERLCETGDFDVIVVDSVAALVPKAEVERDMGESSMGKHALLMSQAMRKITPIAAKSNTLVIFINQLRDKIGVMFGSPETTTGGNALKFYASVRLDVRRYLSKDQKVIGDNDVTIGNKTKVKVVKNKMSPPFRECEFNILYGEGIDKYSELLELAVEANIINKSGSWYSYNDAKIGQGEANIVSLLKTNDAFYEEIREKVIESYNPKEIVLDEPANIESISSSEDQEVTS